MVSSVIVTFQRKKEIVFQLNFEFIQTFILRSILNPYTCGLLMAALGRNWQ